MIPGCIMLSQYGVLHWDMQKSLELFAVVQTHRTIFFEEKKPKHQKTPTNQQPKHQKKNPKQQT